MDGKEASRLTFSRDRRILCRPDFLRVYDAGRRLRGRIVTMIALRRAVDSTGETAPWRLGITASRKTGGATQRNRQKRRLREYFRTNQHQIPDGWDIVVNTTNRLNQASHEELTKELSRLLRGLGNGSDRDGNVH